MRVRAVRQPAGPRRAEALPVVQARGRVAVLDEEADPVQPQRRGAIGRRVQQPAADPASPRGLRDRQGIHVQFAGRALGFDVPREAQRAQPLAEGIVERPRQRARVREEQAQRLPVGACAMS